MASQSVTKEDLETTLHNVNVLLYAVEEVLIPLEPCSQVIRVNV
jgi:hypothetical protein